MTLVPCVEIAKVEGGWLVEVLCYTTLCPTWRDVLLTITNTVLKNSMSDMSQPQIDALASALSAPLEAPRA